MFYRYSLSGKGRNKLQTLKVQNIYDAKSHQQNLFPTAKVSIEPNETPAYEHNLQSLQYALIKQGTVIFQKPL